MLAGPAVAGELMSGKRRAVMFTGIQAAAETVIFALAGFLRARPVMFPWAHAVTEAPATAIAGARCSRDVPADSSNCSRTRALSGCRQPPLIRPRPSRSLSDPAKPYVLDRTVPAPVRLVS